MTQMNVTTPTYGKRRNANDTDKTRTCTVSAGSDRRERTEGNTIGNN